MYNNVHCTYREATYMYYVSIRPAKVCYIFLGPMLEKKYANFLRLNFDPAAEILTRVWWTFFESK